jgi:nitroreductase
LEAARWSATWGDRQPIRFVVGLRLRTGGGELVADDTFGAIAETLKRGNSYARAAAALILVCADTGPDEKTALYSALDAGAAIANATVEAVSRGLVAHPMAGFNADAARETFGIPEGVRPLAVLALGTLGDYATAAPDLVERDSRPRTRLPLDEIAFAGTWGAPLSRGTSPSAG